MTVITHKKHGRGKSGQFLIITALLITVMTMALVVSVQQTAFHRVKLRYKPVNELLLGLSSDLERSLTNALAKASQVFDETASFSNSVQVGKETVYGWKKAVVDSYSSLALRMNTAQEPTFAFNGWSTNNASSRVRLTYDIDVVPV